MALSRKVTAALGIAPTNSRARKEFLYGIELEYENCNITPDHMRVAGVDSVFHATHDGSLRRGGIEFVSVPLSCDEMISALRQLEQFYQDTGSRWVASLRCGLHLHMNCSHLSLGQLYSVIALYMLLEPGIFATFAQGRRDSTFCCPLTTYGSFLGHLRSDIAYNREINNRRAAARDILGCNKYTAMNCASLGRFGTLEMRQPYCTTDFDAIAGWVEFCNAMMRKGAEFEDPSDLITFIDRSYGIEPLYEEMFLEEVDVDEKILDAAVDAVYSLFPEPFTRSDELSWTTPESHTV